MLYDTSVAAVDARTLVPVSDEAGGVIVYIGGEAAYYVLNGEWFRAIPEPQPNGVMSSTADEFKWEERKSRKDMSTS
ncbi:uncharacterized protein METZ01_LOCUS330307 [marine metagenome]|uniref:Uncharacterized protein n=1 Tax=marine metagenome TaxID=408172 RepID=A0A382PVR5_9ZZZZ